LEELATIRDLTAKNVSLSETVAEISVRLAANFEEELRRLLQKRDRFRASPTYFVHLANLAELAGDLTNEHAYLAEAEKVSKDSFFTHRRAVNLLAQGKTDDAQSLFKKLDLNDDVGANLRLAYIFVRKEQLDRAAEFVEKAIYIDPIDFGARMFQGALALAKGELQRSIHSFRLAADIRETAALFSNTAIAYIRLGQADKALRALKRAIRIEPFNQNAVAILADLTFAEKKSKDATASLERYLEFEQKDASMWARLARALIECGSKQRALDVLNRQASVEESSSVYNNIGVVHSRLGNKQKAAQYFTFALKKAKDERESGYLLASRNLLSTLVEGEKFVDAVTLGKEILKSDIDFQAARDPIFSDIYALFIIAVARSGKEREAEHFAQRLLQEVPNAYPGLKVSLVTGLIANLALRADKWTEAESLAIAALGLTDQLNPSDLRRDMLKNNIAFLFLEMGKTQEAVKLLSEISRSIHKEAYPTATLGLLQMKKGRLDKAEQLYREAIRLARTTRDKKRIEQKMHFELGKRLLEIDKSQARRHLTKAVRDLPITGEITKQAQNLLATLPLRGRS